MKNYGTIYIERVAEMRLIARNKIYRPSGALSIILGC